MTILSAPSYVIRNFLPNAANSFGSGKLEESWY